MDNDFNQPVAAQPFRLEQHMHLGFEPMRQGKKLRFFAQFSMADPSEF